MIKSTKQFNTQNFLKIKRFYSQNIKSQVIPLNKFEVNLPEPEYDIDFICNPLNRDLIANNIVQRKGLGNIDKVLKLYQNSSSSKKELFDELSKIPNLTDPKVLEYASQEPHVLREFNKPVESNYEFKNFNDLAKNLNMLRTENLGPVAGSRSYILLGALAQLEQALVSYSLKNLKEYNFQLISVPDILPSEVIQRCGLISDSDRRLVYQLESSYGDNLSLSGTAEMALAYKLSNQEIPSKFLPLKFAAVSRCYRAEVSTLLEERGIYRVHQFTKVEMFVCSEQNKSLETMEQLVEIQEKLFNDLGLQFKVLDMPSNELGAPAYRKIDIEAWMPGRKMFGEISSCSNCTDYQSRRLNIKYKDKGEKTLFAHTLNGTACAIPRMLIAICETNQLHNGKIAVPECLIPFMNGKNIIEESQIPETRVYKFKH